MREIKFRGKRVDNGEWVEGCLINNAFFKTNTKEPILYVVDTDKIMYDCFEDWLYQIEDFEVIPETVCQFTGLKDKNGVEIYEGDILFNHCEEGICNYNVIEFIDGCYLLITNKTNNNNIEKKEGRFLHLINSDCEVIGNIHENK